MGQARRGAVYELAGQRPVTLNPASAVAFPQIRARTSEDLLVDPPGRLAVKCLRMVASGVVCDEQSVRRRTGEGAIPKEIRGC